MTEDLRRVVAEMREKAREARQWATECQPWDGANRHELRNRAGVYEWCADKVDAALAGVGRPEAQGWQPIETAPKDGTWVLTCDVSDFNLQRVLRWDTDTHSRNPTWRDHELFPKTPTHWMPLPPVPVPQETPR